MFAISIFLPVLFGFLLPLLKLNGKKREYYVFGVTLLTSLLLFVLLLQKPTNTLTLFNLSSTMSISFKLDGVAFVFLFLIAILWPLATLYAFEYMQHSEHLDRFYMLYVVTYGVCIALSLADNLITFYLVYECLTFATLPLVMHEMDWRATKAGKLYFCYSIFGAALAFMGILIYMNFSHSLQFTYGGGLIEAAQNWKIDLAYILMFFGFGVKAAILPFNQWLPRAGVAPTPVTALLHAVAVVNAGIYALIRITYYCFGTSFLFGTWMQDFVLIIASCTILYGSIMALKEQHLKRRFAYSTISNLSYMVVGIGLMTTQGLVGALSHMFFHGLIKIVIFFVCGIVLEKYQKEYVYELAGYGHQMPITFACFTIAACALSGVPLFAGFISKITICQATFSTINFSHLFAIASLLISSVLTCAYTFEIVITAYFHSPTTPNKVKDPSWKMNYPLCFISLLVIYFGLFGSSLIQLFELIASKGGIV